MDEWKVFPINSWVLPVGFGLYRVGAYYGPDRNLRSRLIWGHQRAVRLMHEWSG